MEVFTQFSSDLDATTKAMLDHGHVILELLKQPLCVPYKLEEEVIILAASTYGLLDDMPLDRIKKFRANILPYFEHNAKDLLDVIKKREKLSDETIEVLKQEIIKCKEQVI
jgi:F-type H+-transporting ATPase subunit alpha